MICNSCPRQCNADRSSGAAGWCRLDDGIHVASICLHKGEEPPISGEKGIVNVFFGHCNMQCIYCQNFDISNNEITQHTAQTLDEVCDRIASLLPFSEGNLGFVSPTHCIPQMVSIIKELNSRGINPVIIYNSNGYDTVESIRSLEGTVDVWLPDFKYSDDLLAMEYSAARGYSAVALASLKEMVRQCGVTLQTNDSGIATRGVIVRHLVLPRAAGNSIGVLKMIAEEISPNLHISLMSQYYPAGRIILPDYLERGTQNTERLLKTITRKEYEAVLDAFHSLGFSRGWLQDYESNENYRPDFSSKNPFA